MSSQAPSKMMMTADEAVADARKKARTFFESLPRGATEQGTVDALAKVLLDENGAVMRDAADKFAQAVMLVFSRDGKPDEGRELLKKIHAVLTGADTRSEAAGRTQ